MDASLADPVIGRLLDGRYTAQERLAVGGTATVYVGHDSRLDVLVALKVLHQNLSRDPDFVARFHREATAMARLNTPYAVSVLNQGSAPGPVGPVVYLVMELVRGKTLRAHLSARGRLSVPEAVEIIQPVLHMLAAAHDAGIIHRDIEPGNILLGDDGRVRVADFGLACPLLSQPTQVFTQGVAMGTVGYIPPERLNGGSDDTRSDVYAAGVVLFEMLTGQLPFIGSTPMSVAHQTLHSDVPAPSTLVGGIPPELDEFVVRSTARDPRRRPADGGVQLAELRAILPYLPRPDDGGYPLPGPADSGPRARRRVASRHAEPAKKGRRRRAKADEPAAVERGRPEPPQRLSPDIPRLVVTSMSGWLRSGRERDYLLDAETAVIGRGYYCDIRLDDDAVSARHGEFRRTSDGKIVYVDLGSTNGSFVGVQRVEQAGLFDGDQVRIGKTIVTLRWGGAGRRSSPPPPPAAETPAPQPSAVGADAVQAKTTALPRLVPDQQAIAENAPDRVAPPIAEPRAAAADTPGTANPPTATSGPPPWPAAPPPAPASPPPWSADDSPPLAGSPAGNRPRIFLCHSHLDKEAVRDLYRKLRGDGFHPWFDEEDLLPGQDWEHEIRRAIRASSIVLACLSASSLTKKGYVHREIGFALDVAGEQPEGSIYLIPVRLEDCEVPGRLGRWHWVDLFAPAGYDRLLRSLRSHA